MKIKKLIFWLQELFQKKPKTKKAEPIFHAPLNEPFATMQKQHLASQCQSYSSMQDQMCRQQCQSSAAQREQISRNTQVNFCICKKYAKNEIKPDKTRVLNAENCKNLQKSSIPFAIESAIIDALDHAKTKHPHFAETNAEAGTVIAEELLEVNTAALKVMQGINDQTTRDNLFIELAQLNATTIRMMEKLLK